MGPDDAPPHFKVRGAAPELRASDNIRQLTIVQRGSLFPNLTALPKNFTFEAELAAEAPNRAIMTVMFQSKNKQILHISTTASEELLTKANINPMRRAETLSIEEWQSLCKLYK